MRREDFPPDGQRILVSPADLCACWQKHAPSQIAPTFACGTAQHESSYTLNEVDTEASGYISQGWAQVSDGEAAEVGMPWADLLDLEACTEVFSRLCGKRLVLILRAAGIAPDAPVPPDALAYLAIAHNHGIGYTVAGIRDFGLSWSAFKARIGEKGLPPPVHLTAEGKQEHASLSGQSWEQKMACYGDDCLSGGARWKEAGGG